MRGEGRRGGNRLSQTRSRTHRVALLVGRGKRGGGVQSGDRAVVTDRPVEPQLHTRNDDAMHW